MYSPAKFHSASAFKKALSIGLKALEKCVLLEDGIIDAPLLLLGLMYWEASRAMEIEPGAATDIPVHLSESPFGMCSLQSPTLSGQSPVIVWSFPGQCLAKLGK